MLRPLSCAIAVAIILSPGIALSESWKRIKTEDAFRSAVLGKKGTNENGWVLLSANGKMSGVINGQGKIRGKWAWGNGFFCRNIKVGSRDLGQNCQTVHISGNKVRYTRDQGKGEKSVWVLE